MWLQIEYLINLMFCFPGSNTSSKNYLFVSVNYNHYTRTKNKIIQDLWIYRRQLLIIDYLLSYKREIEFEDCTYLSSVSSSTYHVIHKII